MPNANRSLLLGIVLVTAGLALLAPHPAAAQATRTWVSGVGDDANPCSRTAPCKTWAGAISKTAAGGEIDALDPGGYGAVTITKSITLDGAGMLGAILAAGSNGVIVNAGANDRVVLRNLSINGASDSLTKGLTGVRFLAGRSLSVEGCTIANFTNFGIEQTSGGALYVTDTVIRNAEDGAISVVPGAGTARVLVRRSHLVEGAFGLRLSGSALGTVGETVASGYAGPGFWADGPSELALDDVASSMNDVGVRASNGAVVRTAAVTVVGNATLALVEESNGTIVPFSGNLISGNPPGTSPVCEVQVAAINCVDGACPQPACPAVQIERTLGTCKKCKTKGGKTTCTGCPINLE